MFISLPNSPFNEVTIPVRSACFPWYHHEERWCGSKTTPSETASIKRCSVKIGHAYQELKPNTNYTFRRIAVHANQFHHGDVLVLHQHVMHTCPALWVQYRSPKRRLHAASYWMKHCLEIQVLATLSKAARYHNYMTWVRRWVLKIYSWCKLKIEYILLFRI